MRQLVCLCRPRPCARHSFLSRHFFKKENFCKEVTFYFCFLCPLLCAFVRAGIKQHKGRHMFENVRILSELRDHSTDGTCNSLPGWEISFEPQTGKGDPDCRAFSDFGERGLGAGITAFWMLSSMKNSDLASHGTKNIYRRLWESLLGVAITAFWMLSSTKMWVLRAHTNRNTMMCRRYETRVGQVIHWHAC